MIDIKDLPEETKFVDDDGVMWDDKQSLLEDMKERVDSNEGLRTIYKAVPIKQSITDSHIEDIFVDIEECDGYEGQAENCMDSISDEDMKTVLDILNKALKDNVAYEQGELISQSSIAREIMEEVK